MKSYFKIVIIFACSLCINIFYKVALKKIILLENNKEFKFTTPIMLKRIIYHLFSLTNDDN